jgi:hypothetical protein
MLADWDQSQQRQRCRRDQLASLAGNRVPCIDLDILAFARMRLVYIDEDRVVVCPLTLASGVRYRTSGFHFLGVAATAIGAYREACQARLEGDEDGQEDGEGTAVHGVIIGNLCGSVKRSWASMCTLSRYQRRFWRVYCVEEALSGAMAAGAGRRMSRQDHRRREEPRRPSRRRCRGLTDNPHAATEHDQGNDASDHQIRNTAAEEHHQPTRDHDADVRDDIVLREDP